MRRKQVRSSTWPKQISLWPGVGLTGLIISVVSVSFGMISAYIVGLWWFLRHAPFAMRMIAFSLLTFGLAFMAVLAWGLHELFLGTQRAWTKLPASVTEVRLLFRQWSGVSLWAVGVRSRCGIGFRRVWRHLLGSRIPHFLLLSLAKRREMSGAGGSPDGPLCFLTHSTNTRVGPKKLA